jgi:AcrR family transcriptional regulator
MEAAASHTRSIDGEKARRIVEAMRLSVARRGVSGATFDHVAREAGVSRGLLHYYFGTKERLLAEVVRRDSDVRMAALETQLARASSAEDFIGFLRESLEGWVREDPELIALSYELFTLSRRNPEIAAEWADLVARARDHVAGLLAAKQAEGVLRLSADPADVAEILLGLGDGIALRMLGDPARDWSSTIEAGVVAVRALLTDRG